MQQQQQQQPQQPQQLLQQMDATVGSESSSPTTTPSSKTSVLSSPLPPLQSIPSMSQQPQQTRAVSQVSQAQTFPEVDPLVPGVGNEIELEPWNQPRPSRVSAVSQFVRRNWLHILLGVVALGVIIVGILCIFSPESVGMPARASASSSSDDAGKSATHEPRPILPGAFLPDTSSGETEGLPETDKDGNPLKVPKFMTLQRQAMIGMMAPVLKQKTPEEIARERALMLTARGKDTFDIKMQQLMNPTFVEMGGVVPSKVIVRPLEFN